MGRKLALALAALAALAAAVAPESAQDVLDSEAGALEHDAERFAALDGEDAASAGTLPAKTAFGQGVATAKLANTDTDYGLAIDAINSVVQSFPLATASAATDIPKYKRFLSLAALFVSKYTGNTPPDAGVVLVQGAIDGVSEELERRSAALMSATPCAPPTCFHVHFMWIGNPLQKAHVDGAMKGPNALAAALLTPPATGKPVFRIVYWRSQGAFYPLLADGIIERQLVFADRAPFVTPASIIGTGLKAGAHWNNIPKSLVAYKIFVAVKDYMQLVLQYGIGQGFFLDTTAFVATSADPTEIRAAFEKEAAAVTDVRFPNAGNGAPTDYTQFSPLDIKDAGRLIIAFRNGYNNPKDIDATSFYDAVRKFEVYGSFVKAKNDLAFKVALKTYAALCKLVSLDTGVYPAVGTVTHPDSKEVYPINSILSTGAFPGCGKERMLIIGNLITISVHVGLVARAAQAVGNDKALIKAHLLSYAWEMPRVDAQTQLAIGAPTENNGIYMFKNLKVYKAYTGSWKTPPGLDKCPSSVDDEMTARLSVANRQLVTARIAAIKKPGCVDPTTPSFPLTATVTVNSAPVTVTGTIHVYCSTPKVADTDDRIVAARAAFAEFVAKSKIDEQLNFMYPTYNFHVYNADVPADMIPTTPVGVNARGTAVARTVDIFLPRSVTEYTKKYKTMSPGDEARGKYGAGPSDTVVLRSVGDQVHDYLAKGTLAKVGHAIRKVGPATKPAATAAQIKYVMTLAKVSALMCKVEYVQRNPIAYWKYEKDTTLTALERKKAWRGVSYAAGLARSDMVAGMTLPKYAQYLYTDVNAPKINGNALVKTELDKYDGSWKDKALPPPT